MLTESSYTAILYLHACTYIYTYMHTKLHAHKSVAILMHNYLTSANPQKHAFIAKIATAQQKNEHKMER